MSGAIPLWRLAALDEAGAKLVVLHPCTALELARQVLPSKPVVQRAFARGQLGKDGRALTQADPLATGDEVGLRFWHEGGVPIPLRASVPADQTIVYYDPLVLAIDKPAGLLVHGDGSGAVTLTDLAQAWLVEQGSPARAQAVQRLDVETTGLVLFSLAEEFQPALDTQVASHEMRKRYLALVRGTRVAPREGWRTIAAPIGRDRHDARRMRVGRTGKPSTTHVRELAARDGRSLLLVELETGRRHQIRVHLAHIGHPICGDTLYGGERCDQGLMLHAWQERFVHPLTGEELRLRTPWPTRFAAWQRGSFS